MKKILIILGVVLALVVGGWFTLTRFVIDAEAISGQLAKTLEDATGRKALVSQTSSVSLFPTPQVQFHGLRLTNAEGASTPDFLATSRIRIKLGLMDVLSGNLKPREIILDETTLNLEVLPNGRQNWRFEGQGAEYRNYFIDTPVVLNKTVLRYSQASSGVQSEWQNINGRLAYVDDGKVVEFKGDMTLNGHSSPLTLRMNSVDLTAAQPQDVPFQLALQHQDTRLSLQGMLAAASNEPEFVGKIKIESSNIWTAAGLFTGGLPVDLAARLAEDTHPMTLEGAVRISARHLHAEAVQIQARGSTPMPVLKGTLDGEYRFGRHPVLRATPVFDIMDMDYLGPRYLEWFSAIGSQRKSDDDEPASSTPLSGERRMAAIVKILSGAMDVQIKSAIYKGRSVNDIRLQVQMEPERMTLRQGQATFPGDSRARFSGTLRDRETGLTYDGKLEMQGRQMEHFLSLFTPRDMQVPELNLGRFGVRTNMSISPVQIRLSELNALMGQSRAAGSLIFQHGDRLKLESYLRVAGINLDTVKKAVQYVMPQEEQAVQKQAASPGEDLFNTRYLNTRFNWLAAVPFDVDGDFYLQDFVLYGRKGELAQFHLDVTPGVATISKLNAKYNNATITGSYGLRVAMGSNPQFVASGHISELDLADIIPDIARVRNDREWQEYLQENIELMLLQTHRADAKLRIGKLRVRNYVFENLDTEFKLENSLLTINKFQGRLWNGAVNARISVQAGTIPSMSASFAVENAHLGQLSQTTRLLKHAAGVMAVSGQVSTSGVSLHSWFTNVSGELRVRGRDIAFQGFGIANLARAVPVARTVNDIERAAAAAVNGGITRISSVEGLVNVAEGRAQIPQMKFTSAEANGTVDGSVNLMDETVDLSMRFVLLNTVEQGSTPPELRLHMRGDIDNVRKDLETRHLSDYIAQKAAQRALGR